MMTYLMSIPESIRKISEKLNVKSTLCECSWCVFNDQGVKILYIFQDNGTLIISKNGIASKSHWEYIKANKTLLIEDSAQSFLFHPAFWDDTIFALQQDGTEKYLFMINEQKKEEFLSMTIEYISKYFNYIEHPELRTQEQERERERIAKEKEEKRREEEAELAKIKEEAKQEIEAATQPLIKMRNKIIVFSLAALLIALSLVIAIIINKPLNVGPYIFWSFILVIVGLMGIIGYEETKTQILQIENDIIKKRIKHPNVTNNTINYK